MCTLWAAKATHADKWMNVMVTEKFGQKSGVVLIGDIGATNARFRLADHRHQWISELLILPTQEYDHGAQLLQDVYRHFASPDLARSGLAVAGPVSADGSSIEVINTGLTFTQAASAQVLGAAPTFFNDFHAQALSIPHLQQTVQIGGNAEAQGVRAILGPGSGLGMATLVPSPSDGLIVLSSEGGHGGLAPGSYLEAELWSVLAQMHTHVCWETVLCGPGLINLYQAMSSIWGTKPELDSAEEVVAQGLAMDPLCHQTLETFAGLLGSAAGDLALTVGARGGVFISGGITPKLAEMLPSSPLRRRFDERGALADYAKAIPLYLVMDEHPGMLGALHS